MHENSQTEGVGNEVRQRASKDLANNLNLAMVTIYTFLLFFCCFGCYKGEKPRNKGFSPATGSATGWQQGVQRAVIFRMEAPSVL